MSKLFFNCIPTEKTFSLIRSFDGRGCQNPSTANDDIDRLSVITRLKVRGGGGACPSPFSLEEWLKTVTADLLQFLNSPPARKNVYLPMNKLPTLQFWISSLRLEAKNAFLIGFVSLSSRKLLKGKGSRALLHSNISPPDMTSLFSTATP